MGHSLKHPMYGIGNCYTGTEALKLRSAKDMTVNNSYTQLFGQCPVGDHPKHCGSGSCRPTQKTITEFLVVCEVTDQINYIIEAVMTAK